MQYISINQQNTFLRIKDVGNGFDRGIHVVYMLDGGLSSVLYDEIASLSLDYGIDSQCDFAHLSALLHSTVVLLVLLLLVVCR